MNVNNPRQPKYAYWVNGYSIHYFILHPTKQPNPNEWYGILVSDITRLEEHQINMMDESWPYVYSSYPKSQCFRTKEKAQNYIDNECK